MFTPLAGFASDPLRAKLDLRSSWVTWTRTWAPVIFFELKTLQLGALIEVRLANGVTAQFRVTSVVQYAKTGFPDAVVYGSTGKRELNLVTCGGTFDHATGSYESNIVVFSRLVGTVRT